jgi:hypothetical protein
MLLGPFFFYSYFYPREKGRFSTLELNKEERGVALVYSDCLKLFTFHGNTDETLVGGKLNTGEFQNSKPPEGGVKFPVIFPPPPLLFYN